MTQPDLDLIDKMFQELEHAPEPMRPSKMWEEINTLNVSALKQHGLENLRNTVACNYFTFMGDASQFRFIKSKLSKKTYLKNKLRAFLALKTPSIRRALKTTVLPPVFLKMHTYYTNMLLDYAKIRDHKGLLNLVKDSAFGNPPPVYRSGQLITADLFNSLFEYYSIIDAIGQDSFKNVIELGAGYGRNAAMFLQLHPGIRYVIVDIPPALYVSQSYLTQRFPEKKAFLFRPFASFAEIQEQWEQASICFLLPHQMKLLPPKSFDLFLNISSFHEMRLDQITYYFQEIDRLVRGYFYSKQWRTAHVLHENVTIKEDEYPELPHWSRIYSRPCEIQTKFFERLVFCGAGTKN